MKLNEMTMQFNGFHPSEFTQTYLQSMMDELYTESPNGSIVQAVFSRQNHTFKARVRIESARAHFFAVASGRRLKDVMNRVVTQIRKQQNKWKSLRTKRESLTKLPLNDEWTTVEEQFVEMAEVS